MNNKLFLFLSVIYFILPTYAINATEKNEKPFVIPEIKTWIGGEGQFTITPDTRIVYPANAPN